MDKAWKHYANSKKLDTKGHLLHDSIYLKCTKQEDAYWTMDQKVAQGLQVKEG